jgi:hypothetical protein
MTAVALVALFLALAFLAFTNKKHREETGVNGPVPMQRSSLAAAALTCQTSLFDQLCKIVQRVSDEIA